MSLPDVYLNNDGVIGVDKVMPKKNLSNLIQEENHTDIGDIEDIASPTVEKVKKVRAAKKKKEEHPYSNI